MFSLFYNLAIWKSFLKFILKSSLFNICSIILPFTKTVCRIKGIFVTFKWFLSINVCHSCTNNGLDFVRLSSNCNLHTHTFGWPWTPTSVWNIKICQTSFHANRMIIPFWSIWQHLVKVKDSPSELISVYISDVCAKIEPVMYVEIKRNAVIIKPKWAGKGAEIYKWPAG